MKSSWIIPGLLAAVPALAQQPALAVGEKVAGSVGFYTAEGKRVAGVKVGKHR